jgi:hypothetical protein
MRRRCGQWLGQGLARLLVAGQSRPDGQVHRGRPAWLICAEADPALAGPRSAEERPWDAGKYTDAQRRIILDRRRILDQWRAALALAVATGESAESATVRFLQTVAETDGQRISRATLYAWRRDFAAAGMDGLADARWLRKSSDSARIARGEVSWADIARTDPFAEAFLAAWLTPRRRTIAIAHTVAAEVCAQGGHPARSYHWARRFAASIPPQLVALRRGGRDQFERDSEPYIERDYSGLAANELWCSDHHQLDVIVNAGTAKAPRLVRPWLTVWQDLRSRYVVGHALAAADPDTDRIIAAIVPAIRAHGLPDRVYVDNGKDYDSRDLQGQTKRERREGPAHRVPQVAGTPETCASAPTAPTSTPAPAALFPILGIAVTHAWPYHGQSKPAERLFKTIKMRFSQSWDTYTGGATADKPEDLARLVGAGRAPLLQDFAAAFAGWLDADYHQREHLGDAMDERTPAEVFAATLQRKRMVDEQVLAVAAMRRTGPVRVTQQGVRHRGLWYGAMAPEVQALHGQQVMLAADTDLGRVLLFALDGRFLARADANRRLPVNASAEDLKSAIAEKRQLRRRLRDYHQARPRLALDVPALVESAALRRAAERAQATLAATGTDGGGDVGSATRVPQVAGTPSDRVEGETCALSLPSLSLHRTHLDQQRHDIARALAAIPRPPADPDSDSLRIRHPVPVGHAGEAGDGGEADDAGGPIDIAAALAAAMRRPQPNEL